MCNPTDDITPNEGSVRFSYSTGSPVRHPAREGGRQACRLTPLPDKLLLSSTEAAKALSVCPRTLWSLTKPRGPIPVVRIGTRTLYPVDGLRVWIANQAGNAVGGSLSGPGSGQRQAARQ